MQLTCLYHPTKGMVVTDDEELFNELLASGVWFEHPTKAKELRETYEQRLHDETRKGLKHRKQKTKHGPSATQ